MTEEREREWLLWLRYLRQYHDRQLFRWRWLDDNDQAKAEEALARVREAHSHYTLEYLRFNLDQAAATSRKLKEKNYRG